MPCNCIHKSQIRNACNPETLVLLGLGQDMVLQESEMNNNVGGNRAFHKAYGLDEGF
jgi:hypothetical protein